LCRKKNLKIFLFIHFLILNKIYIFVYFQRFSTTSLVWVDVKKKKEVNKERTTQKNCCYFASLQVPIYLTPLKLTLNFHLVEISSEKRGLIFTVKKGEKNEKKWRCSTIFEHSNIRCRVIKSQKTFIEMCNMTSYFKQNIRTKEESVKT
jgi:hypothetical protein